MASSQPVRLFTAVSIPDDIRARLDAALEVVRPTLPQVRWVDADLWHVTLVFLGERPSAQVEPIRDVVAGVGANIAPFTLGLSGIGAFPNQNRPRVLWAGIEPGAGELENLHRALLADLIQAGLAGPDDHFSAHLTLGRVRDTAGPAARAEIGRLWSSVSLLPLPSFEAREIHLMRSQLVTGGPRYSSLYSIPLGGSGTSSKK
jgi:2'-5' RNA ligase